MTAPADEVVIYSDGCSLENPGPGGWAAILTFKGREKEVVGGEPVSTNNRAELMAAVIGLRALKRPSKVKVVSDSQYVVKGMNEWVQGWMRRGWKTASGDPVKNRELWEALVEAAKPHQVRWEWVKGHAGHHYNERCDVLAKAEATKFKAEAQAKS